MRRAIVLMFIAVLFAGCSPIRVVTSYDEVIDKGITDFAEQFNTFVKNMGDAAGTDRGTYEANVLTYNALDAKLDVLIARAAAASEGKGCRIEEALYKRIERIMRDNLPPELMPPGQARDGDAEGCNEKLLVLVKAQLQLVREIHKSTDKCAAAGGGQMSCLRPATAKSILEITNQSINAVSVVETAKRMN